MTSCRACNLLLVVSAVSASAQTAVPAGAPVRAQHAMVVTIHHDATDAGVEVLRAGGNAVDGAVAVGFALAVVQPATGNIGGGGFMLIRPAGTGSLGKTGSASSSQPHFLDYREKAPAAASANMYLDAAGNVIPKMSTVGNMASGVPGSVAGLTYAERTYGRLGLARVMAPAIRLARDGFVLSDEEAKTLQASRLALFPESKRIFQRDGNFYKAGETFQQPELAKTLQRIAADPDDFYKGKMAAEIAAFEKRSGGLITADDLAAYQVKERQPLVGHYRGLEVLTSPPPSSGGIVLLEILNILEGYNMKRLPYPVPPLGPSTDRSPAQIHYLTEAFRRAYMDRGDYLGDPDFNTMPLKQMADPAYAAAWRATIDLVKPSPSATLQRPEGFMPEPPKTPTAPSYESQETTHFSVVDSDGNAVSSTYTLNFFFGSGVTVAGLGFLLNDEMDDFTSKVGVPNSFGLVQGPANAIAPGKRPLSSMTPTIVSELPIARIEFAGNKKPIKDYVPGPVRLVLGSPGGSTIITTVANDIVSVVDNGLDIQQAADAPRFHHQYLPDVLEFDKYFPAATVSAMKATGYTVKGGTGIDEGTAGVWGDSELIARDPKTGELTGGHDNRRKYGKAAGY